MLFQLISWGAMARSFWLTNCSAIHMNIWKIIYLNCGERYEDMIDHYSYTHNLRELDYKIRINCGGCQKIEFLQITWNLFYVKRVLGAVDWCHLFLVFLQNCLRNGIKRLQGNTGENYDKLRLIYEKICHINHRPILLPVANNFIHYQ